MSLPLRRIRRIQEILESNPNFQEALLDTITHPTTYIEKVDIYGVPQYYLCTRCPSFKLIVDHFQIGHTRENAFIVGGNVLIPTILNTIGIEPDDILREKNDQEG